MAIEYEEDGPRSVAEIAIKPENGDVLTTRRWRGKDNYYHDWLYYHNGIWLNPGGYNCSILVDKSFFKREVISISFEQTLDYQRGVTLKYIITNQRQQS